MGLRWTACLVSSWPMVDRLFAQQMGPDRLPDRIANVADLIASGVDPRS